MPSQLNLKARLLALAALAGLVLAAPAPAPPLADPTAAPANATSILDALAGDASGDDETPAQTPPDLLSNSPDWDSLYRAKLNHKSDFEVEFHNVLSYDLLGGYSVPSLPTRCTSNSTKEACLNRLVRGLFTYTCLLKHVEKEYHNAMMLANIRHHCEHLMRQIKEKMRHPRQVRGLSCGPEEALPRKLSSPDAFHRKITAHSILLQLFNFILDSKPVVRGGEAHRRKRIVLVSPSAQDE